MDYVDLAFKSLRTSDSLDALTNFYQNYNTDRKGGKWRSRESG